MDWLGRSMQCHFVTEITEKSCVDAQFSNKNYKEQTVNIPPNVVIEAYTFKYPKAASRNERYTNWYSMHVDCPFTKSDMSPSPVSLSRCVCEWILAFINCCWCIRSYPNERTSDWLNVHFHAFHVWKTLFQLVYNHCQCKSAFRIAFAEICAR